MKIKCSSCNIEFDTEKEGSHLLFLCDKCIQDIKDKKKSLNIEIFT